jgi:hypothetical protein
MPGVGVEPTIPAFEWARWKGAACTTGKIQLLRDQKAAACTLRLRSNLCAIFLVELAIYLQI